MNQQEFEMAIDQIGEIYESTKSAILASTSPLPIDQKKQTEALNMLARLRDIACTSLRSAIVAEEYPSDELSPTALYTAFIKSKDGMRIDSGAWTAFPYDSCSYPAGFIHLMDGSQCQVQIIIQKDVDEWLESEEEETEEDEL